MLHVDTTCEMIQIETTEANTPQATDGLYQLTNDTCDQKPVWSYMYNSLDTFYLFYEDKPDYGEWVIGKLLCNTTSEGKRIYTQFVCS